MILDVAHFTLRPRRPIQSRRKPKETRSVSEGFFDFSNKPTTRYTANVSLQPIPAPRRNQPAPLGFVSKPLERRAPIKMGTTSARIGLNP